MKSASERTYYAVMTQVDDGPVLIKPIPGQKDQMRFTHDEAIIDILQEARSYQEQAKDRRNGIESVCVSDDSTRVTITFKKGGAFTCSVFRLWVAEIKPFQAAVSASKDDWLELAIGHIHQQLDSGCADCAYQLDKLEDLLNELNDYRRSGFTPDQVAQLAASGATVVPVVSGGENPTDKSLDTGGSSNGYAIKGVEFSYLKIANITQHPETEADGTNKAMVLYEMNDAQDADLLAASGSENPADKSLGNRD